MMMRKIILNGKAWEVRHLLRQYQQQFAYVADWIDTMEHLYKKCSASPSLILLMRKS